MNSRKVQRQVTYANLMERIRRIMVDINACRRGLHRRSPQQFKQLQERIFEELRKAHTEVQTLAVMDDIMPASFMQGDADTKPAPTAANPTPKS